MTGTRPTPARRVIICVPARDEAARLPALFAALDRQSDAAGAWTLCLLLDSCTDASGAVAGALLQQARFPVRLGELAWAPPNAGRARAAAMALGLEEAHGADALLLTTDADSAPESDWIASALAALESCDLATGRITRTGGAPLQARVERYYDRLYALRRRLDPVDWDPGPHHHFTGGANMAVRSEAYLKVGGFAPVARGEDALLVDEAQRAGLRVRRDARLVVRTSSRVTGRAPGGLAAALADAGRREEPQVAHPEAMAWQYLAQAHARAYFLAPAAAAAAVLGARLQLTPDHVESVARACPNAESFAIRITPAPRDRRMVKLAEAEAALATLERASLRRAA